MYQFFIGQTGPASCASATSTRQIRFDRLWQQVLFATEAKTESLENQLLIGVAILELKLISFFSAKPADQAEIKPPLRVFGVAKLVR